MKEEKVLTRSASPIQRMVEELWGRIEDVTDRVYLFFTEVWQYLEDQKPDGDGILGMLLRENKEKQKQQLVDILIEEACSMCIEYSYVRGMDIDEGQIKVVADLIMSLFHPSYCKKEGDVSEK